AAHRPADASLWQRLHARALEAGDTFISNECRSALARIEGEQGPSVLVCDATTNRTSQNVERLLAHFGPSPTRADACLAIAKWKEMTGELLEAMRFTERAFLLEPTRYETARAWLLFLCMNRAEDRAAKFVARLALDSRWAGDAFLRLISGVLERLPPATGANVVAWCRPFVERQPGGRGWLAKSYTTVGQPSE